MAVTPASFVDNGNGTITVTVPWGSYTDKVPAALYWVAMGQGGALNNWINGLDQEGYGGDIQVMEDNFKNRNSDIAEMMKFINGIINRIGSPATKGFLSKIGSDITKGIDAVAKVADKVLKAAVNVLKNAGEDVVFAPLLLFKGSMKNHLDSLHIAHDNTILDIASKFFQSVVKKSFTATVEHMAVHGTTPLNPKGVRENFIFSTRPGGAPAVRAQVSAIPMLSHTGVVLANGLTATPGTIITNLGGGDYTITDSSSVDDSDIDFSSYDDAEQFSRMNIVDISEIAKMRQIIKKGVAALKQGNEILATAYLSPYKNAMMDELYEKGIAYEESLPGIALAYDENLLYSKHFKQYNALSNINIMGIPVGDIVTAIMAFFKGIQDKAKAGLPLTPAEQKLLGDANAAHDLVAASVKESIKQDAGKKLGAALFSTKGIIISLVILALVVTGLIAVFGEGKKTVSI